MPGKRGTVPRSQLILEILGESPIPASTGMLIDLLCPDAKNRRQKVWASLKYLRRSGLIAATEGRTDRNGKTLLWTLT